MKKKRQKELRALAEEGAAYILRQVNIDPQTRIFLSALLNVTESEVEYIVRLIKTEIANSLDGGHNVV